jgi:hypothetical protein
VAVVPLAGTVVTHDLVEPCLCCTDCEAVPIRLPDFALGKRQRAILLTLVSKTVARAAERVVHEIASLGCQAGSRW